MQRIGEITALQQDTLEVTFCRPQDCEHCHACEGGQQATAVQVPREGFAASLRDLAAVDLPTGTVVKASLLAYVLPVAGLLGGMALGMAIGGRDAQLLMALLGAAGLGLCVLAVALTEKKRRNSAAWQPRLVKVLPKAVYGEKAPENGD